MCERCYREKYASIAFTRRQGYDTYFLLISSVVDGASVLLSLPSEYREVVDDIVLMLVPSANSLGAYLKVICFFAEICFDIPISRSHKFQSIYPPDKPAIAPHARLLFQA